MKTINNQITNEEYAHMLHPLGKSSLRIPQSVPQFQLIKILPWLHILKSGGTDSLGQFCEITDIHMSNHKFFICDAESQSLSEDEMVECTATKWILLYFT